MKVTVPPAVAVVIRGAMMAQRMRSRSGRGGLLASGLAHVCHFVADVE